MPKSSGQPSPNVIIKAVSVMPEREASPFPGGKTDSECAIREVNLLGMREASIL